MNEDKITLDIVKTEFPRRTLYYGYCQLVSSCERCNKRIRFWCKIKCKIEAHQNKLTKKLLSKRSEKR